MESIYYKIWYWTSGFTSVTTLTVCLLGPQDGLMEGRRKYLKVEIRAGLKYSEWSIVILGESEKTGSQWLCTPKTVLMTFQKRTKAAKDLVSHSSCILVVNLVCAMHILKICESLDLKVMG